MPRLRTAQRRDVQLLRALLLEAAFWRPYVARPPADQALANPELARYVEGFGRQGDFGLIAEEAAKPLGAAWWRHFQAGAPGFGFVDEATPEPPLPSCPPTGDGGLARRCSKHSNARARQASIGSASAWNETTALSRSTSASGCAPSTPDETPSRW
jgi:hypothetical protein